MKCIIIGCVLLVACQTPPKKPIHHKKHKESVKTIHIQKTDDAALRALIKSLRENANKPTSY